MHTHIHTTHPTHTHTHTRAERERGKVKGQGKGVGWERRGVWWGLLCVCNMHALEGECGWGVSQERKGRCHSNTDVEGTEAVPPFALRQRWHCSHIHAHTPLTIITHFHPCIATLQWICWHGDQRKREMQNVSLSVYPRAKKP